MYALITIFIVVGTSYEFIDNNIFPYLGTATTQILQDWAIIVIIVLGIVVLIVFAVLVTAVACTCLRRSR